MKNFRFLHALRLFSFFLLGITRVAFPPRRDSTIYDCLLLILTESVFVSYI